MHKSAHSPLKSVNTIVRTIKTPIVHCLCLFPQGSFFSVLSVFHLRLFLKTKGNIYCKKNRIQKACATKYLPIS